MTGLGQAALSCAMLWAYPFGAKHLGLAVSGGGDSMAMLDLYRRGAPEKGIEISVVTLDHGLRPEAADEAALVAGYCSEHGISHRILRWDGAQATGNLMQAAREARYAMIADWAREIGADAVAVAHTQDDQAETVLMALARAAGIDGLSGMEKSFERNGMRFIRPLLGVSRSELRDYLAAHGVPYVDDPTNEDPNYERVRMRQALPVLDGLGITSEALASVAHNVAMNAGVMRHFTRQIAEKVISFESSDLLLRIDLRDEVWPEIERRLTLAALRFIGQGAKPIRAAALAEMNAGLTLKGKHTLAGCLVTREDRRTLRFTREAGAIRDLCAPGQLWDGRWILHADQPGEVRALGEAGLAQVKGWRDTELPRASLLAHPGLWQGEELVAAPTLGKSAGTCAELTLGAREFFKTALSH